MKYQLDRSSHSVYSLGSYKTNIRTHVQSKFINSVKSNEQLKLSVSSRLLFQEFPDIKLKLWKGHLWSTSYCLLTTVKDSKLLFQTTLDVLKRYVESQGKNIDKIVINLKFYFLQNLWMVII